jgi:hypothetical protein
MNLWRLIDFHILKEIGVEMLSRTIFIACFLCMLSLTLSACETPNVTQHSQTLTPVIATTVVEPPAATTTSVEDSNLTAVSTPSKEDAYLLLVDLLKTNNGCDLPCWWGITPGVSSPSDAYSTLIDFQSISNSGLLYPTSGVIYITYPKEDLLVNINVGFQPDVGKQTVKMLKVFTQTLRDLGNSSYEDVYSAPVYKELLGSYSLNRILSRFGHPKQILVRADIYNYTQSRETFEVTLLYPEIGLFVRYNSLAERIGNNISGCPSKAFTELWLLSPNDKDSYQEILSANDATWEGNFPYSKSVEDAASMTVEEFYQTFKESTDSCVETPLNIWPEH